LAILREIGDRRLEGITLNNLGFVAGDQGDYAAGRTYYEQALAIAREIDNREGESLTLNSLGFVAINQADYAGARAYYEQALTIAHEIGNQEHEGYALTGLGEVLIELGKLGEAIPVVQSAIPLRETLGHSGLVMESLATLGRAYLLQGEISQALTIATKILHFLNGGGALDGAEQPLRIYLTCYQILQAGDDLRATEILQTAYAQLQKQAAAIHEEEQRRAFLENGPVHRQILEFYQLKIKGK